MTAKLDKASEHAFDRKTKAAGCIMQLTVDVGNCLVLTASNLAKRKTWQDEGYDSVFAAEGVWEPGSKEEYCIKSPRQITMMTHVVLRDAKEAKAAGFRIIKAKTDEAGPPGHCLHWKTWAGVEWLQNTNAPTWEFQEGPEMDR